ncbi:MAG TPA: peptidase M28 family protein, partial [Colwellia sp.]|nr:peptidase M28 family protein [Colwellia sp.]
MNKRITSVISGLLFAALSVNFSLAQAKSDNFSTQQLTQIADIKQQALESDLAWDLVESLTTEVGPRMPGTPGDKAGVLWAVAKFKA